MRYASMRSLDISNGENVGVSLFVQGCHFHCYNCFNSSTWDFDLGEEWNEETEKEFLGLIEKPFIERITILGGEPLAEENVSTVEELLRKIRQNFPNKSIWMYTGYIWEDIYNLEIGYIDFSKPCIDCLDKFSKTSVPGEAFSNAYKQLAISYCDVLIDGPYIDSQRDVTLKWRGSKNQRVIDVQKSLKEQKVVLWCD